MNQNELVTLCSIGHIHLCNERSHVIIFSKWTLGGLFISLIKNEVTEFGKECNTF